MSETAASTAGAMTLWKLRQGQSGVVSHLKRRAFGGAELRDSPILDSEQGSVSTAFISQGLAHRECIG